MDFKIDDTSNKIDLGKFFYYNKTLNIQNVLINKDYHINREELINFHKSLPNYNPTKFVCLPNLAKKLKLKNIFIKDESTRYGIKAFKGLGASYAVYKTLEKQKLEKNNPNETLTFCSATDGNHGKSLAWSSKNFGQKCNIFVPAITVEARIKNIEKENANVIVVDGDYDETVRVANSEAQKNNWILVQDTAFEGYVSMPKLIMTGYLTIFYEIEDQLDNFRNLGKDSKIDIVLLSVGVGSWAAIAAYYYIHKYGNDAPKIICVEPDTADCLLESIKQGKIAKSKGNGITIMAGLNCGTPSTIAYEILRDSCNLFIAVNDKYAEEAMRILYHPLGGDERIISGETGASSLAGLLAILLDQEDHFKEIKNIIGLNEHSTVLIINTEGDTDPENFQKIISEKPKLVN